MKSRNEQIAIISLPSSGSTWFAKQLIEATGLTPPPDDNYEFFQPLRTQRHELELSKCFGLEIPSLYRNVAIPSDDQPKIHEVYNATWGQENFSICKEVWSFAKVAFFNQYFRTVCLTRSPDETFPPNRLRVYGWYDAIYRAYVDLRGQMTEPTGLRHIEGRARIGHAFATVAMLGDAQVLKVPVIQYSVLMNGNRKQVYNELNVFWLNTDIDVEKLTDKIMSTREQIKRPTKV